MCNFGMWLHDCISHRISGLGNTLRAYLRHLHVVRISPPLHRWDRSATDGYIENQQ